VPGNREVRFDTPILTINNNNNNKNKETTNILSNKSIIGEGEHRIEDFNYLIGREHIDPDNGLTYIVVQIRQHGRFVAADRRLAASPKGKLAAIHALDIAGYKIPTYKSTMSTLKGSPAPPANRPVNAPTRATSTLKDSPAPPANRPANTLRPNSTPPIIYTYDTGPPSLQPKAAPRLSRKRDRHKRPQTPASVRHKPSPRGSFDRHKRC
jgi:hypothetical protein